MRPRSAACARGSERQSDAPFDTAGRRWAVHGGCQHDDTRGRSCVRCRPRSARRRIQVINGGVRNLANGGAHAATNGETKFLIAGAPTVRILFTIAEGLYRIVARKSAVSGRGRSEREASDGVSEGEVTIVDLPRDRIAAGVIDGRADAFSMWEPEARTPSMARAVTRSYSRTISCTGSRSASTPRRRCSGIHAAGELVECVRAILAAVEEMKTNPAPHFPLIARTTSHPVDRNRTRWAHHAFPGSVPSCARGVRCGTLSFPPTNGVSRSTGGEGRHRSSRVEPMSDWSGRKPGTVSNAQRLGWSLRFQAEMRQRGRPRYVIAHELAHVRQWATGESLRPTGIRERSVRARALGWLGFQGILGWVTGFEPATS